MLELPAISLRQPAATLVAIGDQTWLIRDEPPTGSFLGVRIAIHAAQHRFEPHRLSQAVRQRLTYAGFHTTGNDLAYGAVVATAVLAGVFCTAHARPDAIDRALLDWRAGRFAWRLADIKRLPGPIAASGKPGTWIWTPPDALDPRALGIFTESR